MDGSTEGKRVQTRPYWKLFPFPSDSCKPCWEDRPNKSPTKVGAKLQAKAQVCRPIRQTLRKESDRKVCPCLFVKGYEGVKVLSVMACPWAR